MHMQLSGLTRRIAPTQPALVRLSSLAQIGQPGLAMIERAAEISQRVTSPHRDLLSEGQPMREMVLILSGWACRVRTLADGRRQILGFLLPGDVIGFSHHHNPLVTSNVLTLTELVDCMVGPPDLASGDSGLNEAYALSDALDECNLYRQITRLGRLDAYERVADLLLELHDRLAAAGLAADGRFQLPLTQETIADALGLTSVHVNRTLQALRADGTLTLRSGIATLHDPDALAALIDYRSPNVTKPVLGGKPDRRIRAIK